MRLRQDFKSIHRTATAHVSSTLNTIQRISTIPCFRSKCLIWTMPMQSVSGKVKLVAWLDIFAGRRTTRKPGGSAPQQTRLERLPPSFAIDRLQSRRPEGVKAPCPTFESTYQNKGLPSCSLKFWARRRCSLSQAKWKKARRQTSRRTGRIRKARPS